MRISDWSSDVCSSDLIPFQLSRLAWRGLAPDREVSGVALALDGIDAAFAFIAAVASEAAIIGHRRRVEIEAAVEFVAMLVGDRFREFDHLRQDRKSTRLNSSH